MKKEASEFAMLAGAYTTDPKMATQICKLMADNLITEAVCKNLLKLIMDGKLRTEVEYRWNNYWYGGTYRTPVGISPWVWKTSDITCNSTNGIQDNNITFTAAVNQIASNATLVEV